ncbi:subtilisin-like protease SBT1.2 [Olea europaea var. sylvestris]|uniref:subtilisin-like protease SBT1.2 n=1 Tax=Olea europaea var. sylvestris TaxID=158386 RepID=UPI000C1D8B69|nr:subtilisin-like protease SBT1.2 [Olea europaea var. sylvestris]
MEESRLIYSYHHVFKGFAAKLSPEEVKAMEKVPGFISARPQKVVSLYTTHSPKFLGLNQNMGFWKDSNYGKGVIIGVLDTGITPDHPSFSDEGMPRPPSKWTGQCEFNFQACNNKLIGARYFTNGNRTPLDEYGHGTHTASTAAGNYVQGANLFGNANGTAVGVAPLAHLAIYKVCLDYCLDSDILAAMDAAIEDGVDVLSLSLGGPAENFYDESVAIGAFSAIEKGIFVSCLAGNSGPWQGSIGNGAPWILTLGASPIDRKIRATALLGNNEKLEGESAFRPINFTPKQLPLVYPRSKAKDPFCTPTSLAYINIKGKIVLCETGGNIGRIAKGQAVRNAGGAAMILMNQEPQGCTLNAAVDVLPTTHISYADRLKLKAYMRSTTTPTASISFEGTITGGDRAPMVASFSSRGPNQPSLGILKPDIIGPGVNILAAWDVSIENINTKSMFNIISGTSMSCPHLSGIAALLKNVHPDWSPAAIKSSIMSPVGLMNLANNPIEDQTLQPANVFVIGSGYVNPSKSTDSGLIYDIQPEDYIPYLCGLNYSNQQVRMITNRAVNCSNISHIPESQLNYPSFSIFLGSTKRTYSRTGTNVGNANLVYSVKINLPPSTYLNVNPNILRFSRMNQKITYNVTFSRLASTRSNSIAQGFITWTSTKYSMTSPIVVFYQ